MKTKAELDYETKDTYIVIVTATDPSGATDSITVTINVTDENDDAGYHHVLGPAVPPIVPIRRLSDPVQRQPRRRGSHHGNPRRRQRSDRRYLAVVQPRPIGDEAYADIEGATDASYTPTDTDFGKHVQATASYSDDSSDEGQTAMAATANLVNNAPAFDAETAALSVSTKTPKQWPPSVTQSSPQTPTKRNPKRSPTPSPVTTQPPSQIWPSGQITVAPDASIDYETKTSYSVTVTATDAADASASIEVTIAVNDLGLSNAYDSNDSGDIDKDEAVQAVQDYFADTITRGEVLEVLQLYFAG